MAFTSGGLEHVEDAAAAANVALYAVARLRDRRGYLLSPEDARDLDLVESKLIAILDMYLPNARVVLNEAHAIRQGKRKI